jgi:hypothetical protein
MRVPDCDISNFPHYWWTFFTFCPFEKLCNFEYFSSVVAFDYAVFYLGFTTLQVFPHRRDISMINDKMVHTKVCFDNPIFPGRPIMSDRNDTQKRKMKYRFQETCGLTRYIPWCSRVVLYNWMMD